MSSRFLRGLQSLELDERLLNIGALIALAGAFLPWGQWAVGDETTAFSGFGSYTSFLGYAVFFLNLGILAITLVPMLGGPLLTKKRYRETVRLCMAAQSTVLILAALSVLTRITLEFSQRQVRFGIYVCLAGSILCLFEAVIRVLEHRRSQGQELFHHPEDHVIPETKQEDAFIAPPPPPPPRAPAAEEHRLYP